MFITYIQLNQDESEFSFFCLNSSQLVLVSILVKIFHTCDDVTNLGTWPRARMHPTYRGINGHVMSCTCMSLYTPDVYNTQLA